MLDSAAVPETAHRSIGCYVYGVARGGVGVSGLTGLDGDGAASR